jgi:molybdopterin-synthase adenylyltransferase
MFSAIKQHIEDTAKGEEGAFAFCGYSRAGNIDVLLVRDWRPIPESAVVRRDHRYGLEWSSAFSSEMLARAVRMNAALVLLHSHGTTEYPDLSGPDKDSAAHLFPPFSRILGKPCGSIVLGKHTAAGQFWMGGRRRGDLAQLKVVTDPIDYWRPKPEPTGRPQPRTRHDRMILAIGPKAEAQLAAGSVAVIGLCGGGSHVCQQLAHMGVGQIVAIDHDVVEDVNLGRMIGSVPSDINTVLKTDVMARMVHAIDPEITIVTVPHKFPGPASVAALKSVEIVVACVDSFLVREQINAFCRRHHLPLIDIGLGIRTEDERLVSAAGQLAVVTPDSACLRCGPLLSDEVLERERRERPPGYDLNPDAPGDPQVVSMNGVLASEAANTVLDLITGFSGGRRRAGWWQYNGRNGSMIAASEPVRGRSLCPACAEQGYGDPG